MQWCHCSLSVLPRVALSSVCMRPCLQGPQSDGEDEVNPAVPQTPRGKSTRRQYGDMEGVESRACAVGLEMFYKECHRRSQARAMAPREKCLRGHARVELGSPAPREARVM